MLLQVVLERAKADHERAGLAERTQPQVDAVHETLDVVTVASSCATRRPRRAKYSSCAAGVARGLAVLREEEHEVDVGREIELAAAELAHAEHQQRQALAVASSGRAVPRRELAFGPRAGSADADIGEHRELASMCRSYRRTGEIPPGDAGQVPASEAAQRVEELWFVRVGPD